MKRIFTLIALVACFATYASAQKALYIPDEWKVQRRDTLLYAENDPDNKYTWSKTRSKESDNFICYWDKYYKTEPTKTTGFYNVDIDDLLKKAEAFYAMNVGKLAFCDEGKSKVSKYKMMILMNHTQTWTCYGGGYDFTIGALWLNPSTCKPVGHSVAHEVGHSFQYMCYSDHGGHSGFHDAIGKGSTFWEQTAQWQANQSYPELKWDQSWGLFQQTHNMAMTHEWHRYQSYWWHYYLAEKYGIDIIGKIWQHPMNMASDANEVFMDLMGYDVDQLYKEYFDYAMKMATIDLDVARKEAAPYIGTYKYDYCTIEKGYHQVTYGSCPQSTGFNIIPLTVPEPGTEIVTEFTSLKNAATLHQNDPAVYFNGDKWANANVTKYNSNTKYTKRGFRLGYVALTNTGGRQYYSLDSVYCRSSRMTEETCEVAFTVPANVKSLYLVVSPAPSYYFQHKWDENIKNDDQWPYTVRFTNTDIVGAPTISPIIEEGMPITDATITYDVNLANNASYATTMVTIEGDAAAVLATAFQMPAGTVGSKMVAWTSSGPKDGQVMFYAVNSDGNLKNSGSSANGYGHWFNASGDYTSWGNGSALFSEFNQSVMTFYVGPMPNVVTTGKDYAIRQAMVYKRGTEKARVTFVFNVHITNGETGYTIKDYELSEIVTGIDGVEIASEKGAESVTPAAIYNASGTRTPTLTRGLNIIRMSDGTVKKIYR